MSNTSGSVQEPSAAASQKPAPLPDGNGDAASGRDIEVPELRFTSALAPACSSPGILTKRVRSPGEGRYRHLFSVGCVVAAIVLRQVLLQELGTNAPFVAFYAAVVLAALYGGLRGGLVATVLSTCAIAYFWLSTEASAASEPGNWLAMGIFLVSCTLICGITEAMYRARVRALEAEAEVDRQRVAEALRIKREELNEAQRLAHIGSWYWDAKTDVTSGSDELLRIYGFNPATESMPNFKAQRGVCYPEETWQRVNAAVQHTLQSGEGYELDVEAFRKGTPIWITTRGEVVRDAQGGIVGLRGTVQDITERRRAQHELQESHMRFELAVLGAGVGVWDWNIREGKVYYSPRWKAMFGYRECEIGESLEDWVRLLHPEDMERICKFQEDFLAGTGNIITAEYRIRHKDGSYRWISARGLVVRDEQGKASRMVGSHSDITPQKEAEEALRKSERLYRAIGESIDYGIWVCDPDGRNIYASPSFLKLVGQTQEQCSDFGWGDVLHPEDAARTIAAWKECVRTGGVWDIEHRYRGVDGQWHPILARGVPVKDEEGRIICWAGINLDISKLKAVEGDLKEAQAKLQAYSEHLEKVVASRTARLHETIAELEHFSYAIAHDLRAPLRAMQGFAAMIEEDCSDTAPLTRDYLRRIRLAASRMDQLINDSLNYSKAARQELPVEPVDLFLLIDGLVETYPNLQPDKAEIHIEPELAVVMGNEAALTQCFSNLLGNAVKFAKPGAKARITVRAETSPTSLETRPRLVRVWVEDEGIGIPKDAYERIFGMFQRLDSTREGTGIGLAIVRKVVERMGGKVGVESEEGHGSRFWVDLPRA